MGVRPPDNDDLDDGPDVVEFGIAALAEKLERRDISYPVDRETLEAEYGDLTVPVDASGTEISLRSALEEIEVRQFETERELLDVLHPVFERRRQKAATGILGQLRALLPV